MNSKLILLVFVLTTTGCVITDTEEHQIIDNLNASLQNCVAEIKTLTAELDTLHNQTHLLNESLFETQEKLKTRCTLYEANEELFECWEIQKMTAEDLRKYDRLYEQKVQELTDTQYELLITQEALAVCKAGG